MCRCQHKKYNMTHENDSENSTVLEERNLKGLAERLRQARTLVDLDRPAFCQRYGFVYRTYQRWELGTQMPPLDSLEEFCAALLQEGIVCDVSWLLTKWGIAPYKQASRDYQTHLQVISQEEIHEFNFLKRFGASYDTITRQIRGLFTKFEDEDVELLRVRDQALCPFLNAGDFLIVKWQKEELKDPSNVFCVMQIEKGINIVRCVTQENRQLKLSPLHHEYKPLIHSLKTPWAKIMFVIKAL